MFAFANSEEITAITLPSSLKTIDDRGFANCGFTSITIPSGVTSIGYRAFCYCKGLTSLTCEATTPPTLGSGVFYKISNTSSIPLYVPAGSVEAYQAAAQWNAFNIQGYDPAPAPTPNSIVINGTPAVGDNSISLTYYFDPANVPGFDQSLVPTLKVKCVTDGNYDEKWLESGNNISSGTQTIKLNTLGSFQAGKQYAVCFAYNNGDWVDDVFQSFSFPAPTPQPDPAGYTEVSSFEALQAALQAGNNVRLTANISCTSDITLNNGPKLILDGNGYALNGTDNHRAFYFGGDVTIVMKDLTINAFDLDAGGGAIRNYGTLVLDGCTVSGNHTDGINQGGGAIENGSNAKLYAYNTTFSGNYSSEIGGAINNYRGNLYLANCSFENNYTTVSSAYYGGAIGINNGNNNQVRIINCSFSENKYGTNAGASDLGIYSNPSEYTIAGCTGISIQPQSGSMTTYNYGTATLDYSDLNDIQFSYTYSDTPPTQDEQVPTNADPENPSYHYSTFFHSSQNYKLSNDGTQAFIADLSNNELVLTEIAHGEQVIPANTAVILRKTGSADPVVLVPTAENGASVNPNDNSLEGVDVATPVADIAGLTRANCYVLSGQQGVGFYLINSDYLKAHKAYVKYAGSSNNAPKKMRFVYGQATGIEDVQGNNVQSTKVIENGVLYIIRDGKTYNAMGQMVK